MEKDRPGRLTFATLDKEKGFGELPPATEEEFPVPAWYRSVREFPIDELGVEDICKACRQQIHSEHVVPIALRLLQAKPLAGEMYDGEALASLKSISVDYWLTHSVERQTLNLLAEEVLNATLSAEDDDVREDVKEIIKRTQSTK